LGYVWLGGETIHRTKVRTIPTLMALVPEVPDRMEQSMSKVPGLLYHTITLSSENATSTNSLVVLRMCKM